VLKSVDRWRAEPPGGASRLVRGRDVRDCIRGGVTVKITCVDKEIGAVLKSNFYKIPRFQRPYMWEKEQVEEFWTDAVANDDPDYFIGSMVVCGPTNDTFDVVDGQQRLTTITMVLCALRNALQAENEKSLAQGIHNLVERADINNHSRFVLQTETSYPFLQEHIQKFGTPDDEDIEAGDEEDRLKKAFDFITGFVVEAVNAVKKDTSVSPKNKPELVRKKLTDIRDRLLRLKLIFVELDNEDDAYLIFETLNTRGKDLTVSDLVKSHITRLMKPKNKGVDRASDRWSKLVTILEGSEEDLRLNSFLHHLWLSEHEYTTEKKLFKAIRGAVKKDNATDFLQTLVDEAVTYREIHETSYRKWKKSELNIRASLDALGVFRIKQQLPMIMAVMREFKNNALKQSHVEDILRAIENFHFIFTAVTSQRSSGGISFMYALHARQLLAARDLAAKLRCLNELKKKLRDRKPSFPEFEANFLDIRYTNNFTKQKKLVQYILAKIDRTQSVGVHIDYERMTIEHLAPQNPRESVTATWVGNLGNLIFVDAETNDKLANKDIAAKLKVLGKTNVYLDPSIRKCKAWSDDEIEERTRDLAKLAYEKVWKF
jgi:hypothetical protein